jgi:hypothetical protein
MNSITVSLSISNEEFSRLYRGEARDVICTANDGRTVQFPANKLRRFLTHNGIHGNFKIYFSEQHRFLRIEKY